MAIIAAIGLTICISKISTDAAIIVAIFAGVYFSRKPK